MREQKSELNLFKPGKIGKIELRNRIVMAPMGVILGIVEPDGKLSLQGIDYFAARAEGGTGLIITGGTRISQDIEYSQSDRFLSASDPIYIERLSQLASRLHNLGAKVAVQLLAGLGRINEPIAAKTDGMVAPSPLPSFWDPEIITRELTIGEIERLLHAFELAAQVIKASGIDAVEINAHCGYLVDEFQTALWNKRTDKYGGDLEGRLRFPIQAIRAIKKGAGADFPVIYRFGLTHYLEGGRTIEEGIEITKRLEAEGIDAFHIDAGCYERRYWSRPPTTQASGCMVDLAEMVKKVVRVPVIAVGKLGDPDLAERVLAEGKADFIALGRPLLADPSWANKVKAGRSEDICPCIGCNEGCARRASANNYHGCAVNPLTGKEKELAIIPAKKKKTVLVIGGGPAGMEAAIVAAQRGHTVTLLEKGENLGGNLVPASIPDFKCDYRRLIDYLSTQVTKLGVTVKLGQPVTPQLVEEMEPDAVLIVTGATPIIPRIPGIERDMVVTATDLLLGRRVAGEAIIVVGGGLIGCETALWLAQQGKKVTVIEMLESVAGDMYWVNRMHLLKLLDDAAVGILTKTTAVEVTDEGLVVSDERGQKSMIAADTVVLAVGMEPDRGLFEVLKDRLPEVYTIGDCSKPGQVIDAIWGGFRVARQI